MKLTWQKWLFEDNEISNTETDRKMNTSIIIIPAQNCDNISFLNIVPHHAGYYLHSVLVTSLLFDLGDLTCVYRVFIENIPTSSSLHVLVYFFWKILCFCKQHKQYHLIVDESQQDKKVYYKISLIKVLELSHHWVLIMTWSWLSLLWDEAVLTPALLGHQIVDTGSLTEK